MGSQRKADRHTDMQTNTHAYSISIGELPVDADGREIEYRCGAAEDIEGDPRVAESIPQSPFTVVHLYQSHVYTISFSEHSDS